MPPPEKLAALRHLLAERFPSVPTDPFGGAPARVLTTGISAIDRFAGGLPISAITEVACMAPSCGSQILIGQLLTVTRATRTRVALIDANDSFDPCSFEEDDLAHIVWVRCRAMGDALQATDLLARDANLGLVILDLRLRAELEVRRTPAMQWYRLQRAVEPADLALVIITPSACIPCAQLRLALTASHSSAAFQREFQVNALNLTPAVQRQRVAIGEAAG